MDLVRRLSSPVFLTFGQLLLRSECQILSYKMEAVMLLAWVCGKTK